MKKILLFISAVFLFTTSSLYGQDNKDNDHYNRIVKHKLDFLTSNLTLSSEKEEKFSDLFLEYKNKKHDLRVELTQNQLNFQKSNLSNAEAHQIIQKSFQLKQSMLSLEIQYHHKYAEVLSDDELVNYYKADEEYHQLMIERFRNKGKNKDKDKDKDKE